MATVYRTQPKYLWFLITSFSMVIVLANWFDPRIVHFWGINTDAGTLIFPLTFLLSDLITEVYGYKQARRAIWTGFFFNMIFLLYGQLVIHMPNPPYPTHNALFTTILNADGRIILASTISYFISEPLNSIVMAKLKIKMQGKMMPVRFILSTVVAAALDSTVFTTIAFYGVMSTHYLIGLAVTMWGIKVTIEILGLPFSVSLANRLKRAEKFDMYDVGTRFTLFSLNDEYTDKQNAYKAK